MPRFIICPLNIYKLGSLYQTICISFSKNSLIIKSTIQEFLLGSLYFFFSVLSPEDWPVLHKAILLPAWAVPCFQVIQATCAFLNKGRLFSSPNLGVSRQPEVQFLMFFWKRLGWASCLSELYGLSTHGFLWHLRIEPKGRRGLFRKGGGGDLEGRTLTHDGFHRESRISFEEVHCVPTKTRMGLKSSFQLEGCGTQFSYHLLPQMLFSSSNLPRLHAERSSGCRPLLSVES